MDSDTPKTQMLMEYGMKSISSQLLWNYISSENGLKQWFADKVKITHKEYEFAWSGTVQRAHLVAMRSGVYLKLRWEGDPNNVFFEMRISKNELTGETMLSVSDFGDRQDDVRDLWDAQIEVLKRILGC